MGSETSHIANRINRAAAQILDNEQLTAELDDQAAKTLIDWGVACATSVVSTTENLSDEAAEEATYPRLKAVRRMMRDISKWATTLTEGEHQAAQTYYQEIMAQAALVYDHAFSEQEALNAQLDLASANNPQQLIQCLRQAIEPDPKIDYTE